MRPAPAPPLAANRNLAADTSEATRAESTWHVSTRLALPAPNKAIGLTAQTPEVQLVCRGTMDEIKISLFFTEFFPVLAARAGFVRPIMITVAERDAVLVHVLERLRSDPNFAAILACIVSRLSASYTGLH